MCMKMQLLMKSGVLKGTNLFTTDIAAFLFPLFSPCENKLQFLLMFGSATEDKHFKSVIFTVL